MRRQLYSYSHFHIVEAITSCCFYVMLFSSHVWVVSSGSSTSATDELALISFKSMLSSPSEGLLASWNKSSNFCSWPGVVCSRRHPERVVAMRLDTFNLSGRISPSLSNLSLLRELDLSNNHLTGEMHPELGQLIRLQVLNLSTNYLQGSIPATMGRCARLKMIDLSNNQLEGDIPAELGALKNLGSLGLDKNGFLGEIPRSLADLPSLEALSLSYNKLSGEMPPALGNLTNLFQLRLEHNMLSGVIPSTLGMLSRLSWLSLGFNNLTGLVPASIWNISSLKILSFHKNMLSGVIPPGAFSALPRLLKINLDCNQFHGHIPASIANASNLLLVQLGFNYFSGIIPPEVGGLRNLTLLAIQKTSLETKDPKGWEFISALTNCSNLQGLFLLLLRISILVNGYNAISGSIPEDIGNLVNLQSLLLNDNSFSGTLPSSLSRLKGLQALYLQNNNKISGSMLSIGNLTELTNLALDQNAFSGRIPRTIGNLTKLLELHLSSNNFVGSIPSEIFNIRTLAVMLDISNNNLEGSIPQEIGNLKNLIAFYAYSNKLSGEIPSTLGDCQLLQSLYLLNNTLTGSIPSHLSQLKGLEYLDLSSNNLSGHIPDFLGNFSMLYYLNLSFNSFGGKIPNFGVFSNSTEISIHGNDKLCGGIPDLHLPPCSSVLGKTRHKFPLIPIAVSLTATIVILSLFCVFLSWRKTTTKLPSTTSMQGHPLISYPQLVRATDGFSNLLGSGTFGTVFKGNIGARDGQSTSLVAVKVLKLQTPGGLKSFTAECEALRHIRHRNLVKIITVCSSIDNRGNEFKAIVFDFMPNGSLEGWLHRDANDQAEKKYLTLPERISILLDVAYALDYLHLHGPVPVVHCDLKPSNVFLDAGMVAHVGDFGLAKILFEGGLSFHQSMSSMAFRGTIGYAAPEYGAGNMVSTNGDIYSYGILVLETITGKRPTDNAFRQGSSLREYVELGLRDGVMAVVDILSSDLENGLQTVNSDSDCLVSLLRLGLSCSEEMPSSRMPTGGIIKELHAIKDSVSGNSGPEEGRN
ncbi:hypothetical protein ACP70R_008288 [Stipagrostis hirtigluma subsp. patula]